jgi:hypothetical protein
MAVDLVGPHGYVHNWHFVGIPGVSDPRRLQPGDKIRTSFGPHGLSAEHEITQVHHTSNMTTARVRNTDTGEIHTLSMPHHVPGAVSHGVSHPGGGKLPTGKASESTAGRKALLKAGHALPPAKPGGRPGFPIGDAAHWDKAFQAVGRSGGGARRAALRKLLIRTAPEFGKSGKIKGSWLEMSNPVDLVGPKGYVHGWIYEGKGSRGPHPSLNEFSTPGNARAKTLRAGDRVMYGHTGVPPTMHDVLGVKHLAHHTVLSLRNRETGESYSQKVPHGSIVSMSRKVSRMGGRYVGSKNMANGHQRYVSLAADDTNSDYHAHYHTHASGSVAHGHAGFGADSPDGSYTNDIGDTTPDSSLLRTPANTGLRALTGMNPGQIGLSNTIALARPAVTSMGDVLVSRDGSRAVIRHRRGGLMIGTIGKNTEGQWVGSFGDGDGARALTPHTHQRAALAELIGTHNSAAGSAHHRPAAASEPLIPRPTQTPLMQRFGIPAATTLATPMNGSSDGPRATGSDSGSGPAGLSPKGVTIYKKLCAKGFPAARALAFARRAQNMGGSGS